MPNIFEQYIYPFFVTAGNIFTIEWIFWGAIIIEVLLIIYFLVRSFFAYELKLFRKVDALNLWLLEQNHITEENLIEFNNKMKRVPKILRYQWQQYMLYRDKAPSHYMSLHNCVENPIKSSKLTTNMKVISAISSLVAAFAFLLASGALEGADPDPGPFVLMYKALITPLIVIVLNTFYVSLLKVRQSNIQVDLFETFHIFERLMDRASTTIPQYVDFEVLFTRTEIKKGIPVLNEYLEKRARQEEEELEKARINSVEHIQYNFEEVGLDGSLLLERAMRECEIYTNLRARLMLEIGQIESEIESYKKSYENTQKDYQKKLQASKENIERLRTQQETTTNRIESNYIRKQQTDEIKKQQQVEKDFDDATIRYKQEVSTISQEVEKRKVELEEKRKYIETVMVQEFKTYSSKVFEKLDKQAIEKSQKALEDLQAVNKRLTKELEETNDALIKKSSEAEIARGEAVRFSQALVQANEKIADILNKKNKNIEQQPVQQAIAQTNENEGYYDDRGYYIFPNGTYYDNQGNFFDGSGGYYDAAGNYHSPTVMSEDVAPQVEPEPIYESAKAEVEEPYVAMEESMVEEPVAEVESGEKEGTYDEKGNFIYPDGSYYDERGYFIYPDGTYYDDKGNFFDGSGGYYDASGEYHAANNPTADPAMKEPVIEAKPAMKPQVIAPVEEEYDEETSEEAEEKESNSENVVKKSRGRPKKETVAEPVEEKPKGTRGRPKKESVEEESADKPKGTRGRPKKEVAEEEPADKPKGTRGRPKKETTAEPVQESTEKKGRGRPRKTPSLESLKTEMEELAKEAEALQKSGGNQARIDEINERLGELVLQIENAENDA